MGEEEWDLQTVAWLENRERRWESCCTQYREDVQKPRDSQGAAVLGTGKMSRSPEIPRELPPRRRALELSMHSVSEMVKMREGSTGTAQPSPRPGGSKCSPCSK